MPSASRPVRIAPSILSADFARLGAEVEAIAAAGADYVHVDVMDGHFVPNLTIGPVVVEAVRRVTTLPLDVHLMIEDAERWVGAYARAGADLIGVHVEACPHLHRTIGQIASLGKRPCVVLNPHTPLEMIRWVLPDVAMVLLMSVNPGFGGQSFIGSALAKIRELRRMIDDAGLDVDIEVDGGVKLDNIGEVVAAGADVIVSGSGVFGTADYAATIAAMKARAAAARG
ncbi:MAG: ribulose-phosphate 3-epimerase [Kofleriaceae bacterium]|nr:ribulose-phosphate 3-epimerase [Myxococcales bacterium]MCB9564338.1 ribulose-phosphate 3-epimerase [Kofleriaceae bacterium]MCB9574686.1 ribulose-phosphate 3-epimerase [Kofleriaceae bacterium]